jgi:pimeloyl-ACP methyl ester carboxylesterase
MPLQGEGHLTQAERLAAAVRRHAIPVLIVHGSSDVLVPAANSRRLAALLPGAQVHRGWGLHLGRMGLAAATVAAAPECLPPTKRHPFALSAPNASSVPLVQRPSPHPPP